MILLASLGSSGFEATGGTITTYSSGGVDYKVHSFLSTGDTTFQVLSGGDCDYFVVAGGGGGGGSSNDTGGGGGAGYGATGGNGGSGVVILRYSSSYTPTFSVGLTVSTTTVGSNKVSIVTAGTGTVIFG